MSKCTVYRPDENGNLVAVLPARKVAAQRDCFGVWNDNSQSWEAGPMSLTDAVKHAAACGDEVMNFNNGVPMRLNATELKIVRKV